MDYITRSLWTLSLLCALSILGGCAGIPASGPAALPAPVALLTAALCVFVNTRPVAQGKAGTVAKGGAHSSVAS